MTTDGKYDRAVLSQNKSREYFRPMEDDTINGIHALQLSKEISKLPDGCFTIAFFPYSRAKNHSSDKLTVKEGCKFRAQLPEERFSIDSDNFFLFSDNKGEPKACYRILLRYIGFPHDNYKLRKVNWL